jgi:integrase
MLRHSCGFALANKGHDTRAIQDWLGHKSIQRTVRYTELPPTMHWPPAGAIASRVSPTIFLLRKAVGS